MPHILKKVLFLLCCLLLLAVGLLLSLAGTQQGTRLLAGQAQRWSGGALDFEYIQGRLFGPLRLEGVRIRQPGMDLHLQAMQLDWQAAALLTGRLEIIHLEVQGIRIAVAEVDRAAPPATPFRPADLKLPLDIRLRDITLRDLELQAYEQPARTISEIALAARLDNRELQLQQLAVHAPEGSLAASGSVLLTDTLPLQLDLDWEWRLADERRAGGQLQAHGDARVVTVSYEGRGQLPVNAQGELRDILGHPHWELVLDWPELLLPAGAAPRLLGPGQLSSSGNLDEYIIASDGLWQDRGPGPTHWSLQAGGNSSSLQLSSLVVASSWGELALTGSVDWRGPLAFDLDYRVGSDQLVDLHPQLPARLDLLGRLHGQWQGETLTLEQLTLALEHTPLRTGLQGELRLPAGELPVFDGTLQWSGLQWPLEADSPAFASPTGRLDITGTQSAYQFSLAVALAGTQIPPGDWQGLGDGDSSELRLQSLLGKVLGGELDLSGSLGWQPALAWTLRGAGRDLNPGEWQPELPGRLALALRSSGQIDPEQGLLAEVELDRLAGQLAKRDFDLHAAVGLAAGDLSLKTLELGSGGNQLSARGQLSPLLALSWELAVPHAAALLPEVEGSLAASGRLDGSPGQPQLQARLQSHDLRLGNSGITSLETTLRAGLGSEAPLQLDLELGPLQNGEQLLLQSAQLQVVGTTSSHWLELDLQSPTQQLRGRLEGGLDPARAAWSGQLTALDARSDSFGAWGLARAAAVGLAAAAMDLGETCLQAAADTTRFCATAQWQAAQGSALTARLEALPLERLLPTVSGEINGRLDAGLAADGAVRTLGSFSLSPGQVRVELQQGAQYLTHDGGALDLSIGPDGLDARLQFKALEHSLMQAELQLPRFDRLPLSQPQPLTGRIRAAFPDLRGLQAWVPELATSAGRLHADLQLAGSLDQPVVLGELALADGAADIPQAGLQLRQIELRASTDPDHAGQLGVAGGLVSGPGRLDIQGLLDLPGNALELSLKGDRVELYDTPDARVLASPDLRIGWREDVIKLRGRLLIPEADITPRLGFGPGALAEQPGASAATGRIITPSADVVVLNTGGDTQVQPAPIAPFRLDNQIELILGKQVRANALGLVARITGAVTFTNRPEQADLVPYANGRLSIEDGTVRAFGQDLEIETGQLIFAAVPATEPELNLRAVRWIDNDPEITAAGIIISGAITEPSLQFFSRPQLDPSDIQSYLLTGRSPGARDSVLSIGTYLNRKFYVGYGYNLLEKTNEFNALYTITPRYGVGATVGEADNILNLTFTHEN